MAPPAPPNRLTRLEAAHQSVNTKHNSSHLNDELVLPSLKRLAVTGHARPTYASLAALGCCPTLHPTSMISSSSPVSKDLKQSTRGGTVPRSSLSMRMVFSTLACKGKWVHVQEH